MVVGLALSEPARAADGLYIGANAGQLQFDEHRPTFSSLPVVPPPILYPVCGGVASFQFGSSDIGHSSSISGDADAGVWVFGWRRGNFALELSQGPDVDLAESATVLPFQTTQASCTTAPPITVSMVLDAGQWLHLNAATIAALYDLEISSVRGLRIQLRLQAAEWHSSRDWYVSSTVFETSDGVNFVGNEWGYSASSERSDGVDIGYGFGLIYALDERFDLRLAYLSQTYDAMETKGTTLTATFSF